MIPRVIAVWLVVSAVVVTGRLVTSGADFTARAANPGNSFGAATAFPGMRLATGTYVGNAADPRVITGIGFAPDVVIVKGNVAQPAVIRTATMSGDLTKPMIGATSQAANLVESLDSNGFTIGSDPRVNQSGAAYYWTAFKAAGDSMSVGTYAGNGAAARSVAGIGFSPEAVTVLPANAQRAQLRAGSMTRTFQYDANVGITNGITSFDSNGFTVGNNAATNTSGITYHYIAWNAVPGAIEASGYTGNNTDNRNLPVAFQPQYMFIRSSDTATAREGAHRPSSLTGSGSLNFSATVNDTNSIQALQTTGFQVGTDASVNASGVGYGYVAFRDDP